jgi:hypothetical protein
MRQDNTKRLHELLVQEFRLWQALVSLTRLERRLLVECDVLLLVDLARRKGALLAELTAAQQIRRQLIGTYKPPGSHRSEAHTSLEDSDLDEIDGLSHLVEGIQLLASQIGEQVQANYALADCAVKRLWALNGWLQQESQTSLPALLASLVMAQPACSAENPPSLPNEIPEPAWIQPLELLDQDFFEHLTALRAVRTSS